MCHYKTIVSFNNKRSTPNDCRTMNGNTSTNYKLIESNCTTLIRVGLPNWWCVLTFGKVVIVLIVTSVSFFYPVKGKDSNMKVPK